MKQIRENKGITLVALLVTVIILLILAAVAILAIQRDDVLTYANEAASIYGQSKVNEQEVINGYSNYITVNTSKETSSNEEEYMSVYLNGPSSNIVSASGTLTYSLYIDTNCVIKTVNIQPKLVNSSGSEFASESITVSGSGNSYTITIDRSNLSWGEYKVKIPEGAIVTNNGISSEELISKSSFSIGIELPRVPLR